MEFRWLEPEEIVALVNPSLALQGWPQLNTGCCRVLGAFEGDRLIECFTLQLYPVLGPLLRVDNTVRDNGETSRELAQRMQAYLKQEDARGYMTIADNPLTERLCERFGMKRVDSPVFVSQQGVVH